MSLCIIAGGKVATLAAAFFTLSWTHSVEKVEWQESWQVLPSGLAIVEARVRGSGAGMEPPEGARFSDGWWIYRPSLGPLPELSLSASGASSGGWLLCASGECREFGVQEGPAIILRPCGGGVAR